MSKNDASQIFYPDDHLPPDFSDCAFPSDSYTIGKWRKYAYPEIDVGAPCASGSSRSFERLLDETIGDLLTCEREVAFEAYAAAHGKRLPDRDEGYFEEGLIELYVKLGIATGKHHASELVRSIKVQSRDLATKHGRDNGR